MCVRVLYRVQTKRRPHISSPAVARLGIPVQPMTPARRRWAFTSSAPAVGAPSVGPECRRCALNVVEQDGTGRRFGLLVGF